MITCIMPTMAKRRQLWPAALKTFARQDYQGAFLLIGIDARDACETALIDQLEAIAIQLGIAERVEVVVTDEQTLGGKRNALCRHTKTPWIAFWDDDDWHAPRRLTRTIEAINGLRYNPVLAIREPILLGSHTVMMHEIIDPRRRTFTYEWSGKEPYFVGGTLCFERALWEAHPFKTIGAEATVGDEAWWQLSIPDHTVFRHEFTVDPTMYCAFIHKLNTSNTQAPQGDPSWRPYGENLFTLADLIGEEALALWEDAHARMLLDPLIVGSVGGHVASVRKLFPDHLV